MKNQLAIVVFIAAMFIAAFTFVLQTQAEPGGDAAVSTPTAECPYKVPDAIFEGIADSIVVGEGNYRMGRTSVLVVFELIDQEGNGLQTVSIEVAGSELFAGVSSESWPVTDLPDASGANGYKIINAIDPENQDPCYE